MPVPQALLGIFRPDRPEPCWNQCARSAVDRDVSDGLLIQQTQNRDTLALQLKLTELILATKNASNHVGRTAEHLPSAFRTRQPGPGPR